MIGIIAAVSSNGIIGVDGKLPWNYPADMKYFKATTTNGNIIFGRKTFESIGKPLPKRRNIVISSKKIDVAGIETFPTITEALNQIKEDNEKAKITFNSPDVQVITPNTWFCGGASIYQESMNYVDQIHLTITPDVITDGNVVRFPWINPRIFVQFSWLQLTPGDDTLRLYIYNRLENA